MARFGVGDRVRVLETALEGRMQGSRGKVFPIVKVSDYGVDFPYWLTDGEKYEGFGEDEVEAVDVPTDPQPRFTFKDAAELVSEISSRVGVFAAIYDRLQQNAPAQEKTHDYMLGYADGYQEDPLFLNADGLRRDFENESADKRAGFRAGVLQNLDDFRAAVLRDLEAAGI